MQQQHIDQDDVLIIVALQRLAASVDNDIAAEHCWAVASELADQHDIDPEIASQHLSYSITP